MMKPNPGTAVFLAGLAAIGWVAHGYLGTHPLALTVTALIAAVYLLGALELSGFHRATRRVDAALAALPERVDHLDDWLATVDPSLRGAVRLRIEGERSGLPGPAMAPYLVGLLVLLGMLGTFLGMVVTLNGTVLALESTTDLAAMRSALAAPVKGLGLAFGTSVAGVSGSAMLGLLLAWRRRERLRLAQRLDAKIATSLQPFSLAWRRRQTLLALQQQSRQLPELVATMQSALTRIDARHEALTEGLLSGQQRFVGETQAAFAALAGSVERSLQRGVHDAVQAAGRAIEPLVESTMNGIGRESGRFQQQIAEQVGRQLDGFSGRFDRTLTAVAETLSDSLTRQQAGSAALLGGLQQALDGLQQRQQQAFEQQSTALLATVSESHVRLQADLAAADRDRLERWKTSLDAMQRTLHHEWQQAGSEAQARQLQICGTLEDSARAILTQAQAQARDTLAEVARLVDTASQAPQAAADVIAELRAKQSDSLLRDNALLDERSRILGSLNGLLDALDGATMRQRSAIDSLVDSSAAALQRAGEQFDRRIDAGAARIESVAAEVSASSVEAAGVGEAFADAVRLFGDASSAMLDQLQRIEAALTRTTARSDQQLGYFVAQAREIIDLSVSSQQQIIEQLQQLTLRREPLVGEPA